MSFLINGLKSVGSGLVATGQGALWLTSTIVSGIAQGAQGTKHMAVTTHSAMRKFALETVPGTASALKGRAAQIASNTSMRVKGAASEVATFAIEAAKESAISKAVRNDDELFYRIKIVGQKISSDIHTKRPVSPVNRNELAELLEEFLEIHISDVPIELREPGRKYFNLICEKLRNPSEELASKDLDDLAIILKPYMKKHRNYTDRKLQEAEELKKVPYIITQAPAKLSPAETKNRIENQLSLLKFNAIKLVAGSMLINSALGIYTFGDVKNSSVKESLQNILNNHVISYTITDQTDIVYFLIEASNKISSGKASVKIFELLINTVINHSGKSVLTRALAKIQCRFLYKLISSYVGNLMDNLKGTLANFAELPPAEQLEKITKLLVDPVVGHLESKPDPNLSPAEQIKQIILGTKLLDTFIDHFLNRFLDRFNQPWLQHSQYICLEKAASSPHLAKAIFFQMLAGLIGLAVHTLSPIQSVLSDTVHFLVRKIIVGICPTLSDATKESLAIGTEHAWHSVKSSLLLSFQQVRLNRLELRPEDPTFDPPKEIPAEVTQQWENLLGQLFKKLAEPIDGIAPPTLDAKAWGELSQILIDLGKYTFSKTVTGVSLEEAKTFEARVAAFMAQHKDEVVPALQHLMNTPGILDSIKAAVANLALGTFAQENYINETLLVSLESINANSFNPHYEKPSERS